MHHLDPTLKTIKRRCHNLIPDPSQTNSSNTPPPNPTKHIKKYMQNFISEKESVELSKFISEQEDFKQLNGRSVISFGELYNYTGSPRDIKKSIPETTQNLISKIDNEFPESGINSCLINKYVGSDSFLPKHSDNEKTLKPQSDIYTISIGRPCTVKFLDSHETKIDLSVESESLYIMSQASQFYWTHELDPDPLSDSSNMIRYSLTFRCVGENYLNFYNYFR